MQEKHNSKEEQETTAETRAISNAAKALQDIQPDAIKAAAAAAEQAAGIPQESIQAAEQTISNMPLQDDFDKYINAIVNATSFADMTETEKAAYLQSVKELNAQLKGNIEKLQRLVNLENYNNALLSQQLLNGTILQVYETLDGILTFYQSKTWAYFSELFPDMADYFAGTTVQQETYLDTFFLLDFCHKLEAAEPFTAAEIEAYKKKTGKDTVTFKEFQKEVLPLCLEQAEQLAKNPAKFAKDNGAVTTIGNRIMLLSDPDFQNSFTTKKGAKNGIFTLDKNRQRQELTFDINIPFLQGLLKAVYLNYISGDKSGRVRLYYPAVAKELGIDTRQKPDKSKKNGETMPAEKQETRAEARRREMESFIIQIQQLYGAIPGQYGYFQLLNTPWYDDKTEQLDFASPYMMKLIELNEQKEHRVIESGKHYAEWKCDLMHSTVANERNKSAVEMAQRVLVGVQQRGTTRPDSKLKQYQESKLKDKGVFTWHISCKGLIIDCPLIKNQLERQKNNSGKTMALKRAFTTMYKILRTKSDLFDYYIDVSITEIIPTYSTLNECVIYVRHYGKNPNYKPPQVELPKRKPVPKQEEKTPQENPDKGQ